MIHSAPIFLHYLDRELTDGVHFRLKQSTAESVTHILLAGTTGPLYCALSLVWESPLHEGDITSLVTDLVQYDQVDLFSRFTSVEEFLESKCQTYKHVRSRYRPYFKGRLDNNLIIGPTHWKDCSTTRAVELQLECWAKAGAPVMTESGQMVHFQELISPVLDTLRYRDDEGITFPLFRRHLRSSRISSDQSSRLRSQLLSTYCRHYLDFANGVLPTGIRGLSFFDDLSYGFPFYDVPILHRVLRACGLSDLYDLSTPTLLRRILSVRGDILHRRLIEQVQLLLRIFSRLSGVQTGSHPTYGSRAALLQTIDILLDSAPRAQRSVKQSGQSVMNRALERVAQVFSQLQQSPRFRRVKDAEESIDRGKDMKTDILLTTATPTETKTVIDAFSLASGRTVVRQFIGDHTYYHFGSLFGCNVALVQCEMGSGGPSGSLITVTDAIADLCPASVVMLGIAFGLRPKKQKLCDLLVAKQVLSYELQRVGVGKRLARGDRAQCAPRLLDRFRATALEWKQSGVHFGLMISCEKLVDSPLFLNEILTIEPEALGGEMEGAGLYAACIRRQIPWILIKGICDWGDGNKKDGYQEAAAANAAKFVLSVLRLSGTSIIH